jgi:hypothetical protein
MITKAQSMTETRREAAWLKAAFMKASGAPFFRRMIRTLLSVRLS